MNFKTMIDELVAAGLSQATIASEVGIKQPSLFAIRKGKTKDMRYSNGVRLIALYQSRFPNRPIELVEPPEATD